MVSNIAVIGAGQLGSRHIQSLACINRPVLLQVVDPFPESLQLAKVRYEQVAGQTNVQHVDFLHSVSELSDELDLVVIATNADVRRAVLETLLAKKKVKYLILEKVLFQTIHDYTVVQKLLLQKGIYAFVNCPRRIWPFYKYLRGKLEGTGFVNYYVSASQLGIGCNTIHFLDQFVFLTGQSHITLNHDRLDANIITSKRKGFIEFTGTLSGISETGSSFAVTSYPDGTMPLLIQISSNKLRCVIQESIGKAWIAEEGNGSTFDEVSFNTPLQSQLTHLVVQDLLDKGECGLTSYEESMQLHLLLISAFLSHLQIQNFEEVKVCPIT